MLFDSVMFAIVYFLLWPIIIFSNFDTSDLTMYAGFGATLLWWLFLGGSSYLLGSLLEKVQKLEELLEEYRETK
jgi:hypothetical protein